VLENDASANAKIGVQNQWMAVKAPDGTEGFVAGWLVNKAKTTAAPAPGTPPAVVPVPKDAPVVKTSNDGVKLRTKPETTDATILKIMPIGTELKCLEPATEVKRKTGVNFEWLKVADVQGVQGVVAAWYVSIVSLGAFGPQAQRQGVAPSFDVGEVPPVLLRTTEDRVAFRSDPFISVDTLIYRMPKDAELIAIEDPSMAGPKVGEMGNWIHVRDVKDNEGYVAAWLVKERPLDPIAAVSPKDS
jgi:hypothetical protein